MKVVILCGGQGSRIRDESHNKPKPLVEVGGNPIIWHIMKYFSSFGHNEFILALGYKGEMIKEYFLNYNHLLSDFTLDIKNENRINLNSHFVPEDWKITFVNTGLYAETGTRLSRIQEYTNNNEPFFLTYSDVLTNMDCNHFIEFHRSKGKTLTMLGVKARVSFGVIDVSDGIAIDYQEKPYLSQYINGGYYVCSPDIFDYLSSIEDRCVFEKEPINKLLINNEISVYEHSGFWECMDTFKQCQELNKLWDSSVVPWKVW